MKKLIGWLMILIVMGSIVAAMYAEGMTLVEIAITVMAAATGAALLIAGIELAAGD